MGVLNSLCSPHSSTTCSFKRKTSSDFARSAVPFIEPSQEVLSVELKRQLTGAGPDNFDLIATRIL